MSWVSKTAARLDSIIARPNHPPIHDSTLPIAQSLNYDALSYIFILSTPDWKQAPFTLSSVCSHWRHIALSVPQIWSIIYFAKSTHPKYIKILLARSDPLPLHVSVPSPPKDKQLKWLSTAADRIICMKITNSYNLLQHQLPVLERLELANIFLNDHHGHRYESKPFQFPHVRELNILNASMPLLRAIAAQSAAFPALQKLVVKCDELMHGTNILRSVSSTLVSLHLFISSYPYALAHQFVFPQLRHLKTYHLGASYFQLNIDAPRLESVDEESDPGCGKYTLLQLRNPESVKYLRTGKYPVDLASYSRLEKIWVHNITLPAVKVAHSLQTQISFCPELKEIMFFDDTHHWSRLQSKNTPCLPGVVFSEVSDYIHATGRDIRVQEFVPSELNLPGSMPRCNECPGVGELGVGISGKRWYMN